MMENNKGNLKIKLQNLEIQPPYGTAILLLGTCPKEEKSTCGSVTYITMSTALLLTTSRTWNQIKYSSLEEHI